MRRFPNVNRVADRAQDWYEESRKMAKKGSRRANSFIHRQPVLSTILGVGAGLLLGRMFGGK